LNLVFQKKSSSGSKTPSPPVVVRTNTTHATTASKLAESKGKSNPAGCPTSSTGDKGVSGGASPSGPVQSENVKEVVAANPALTPLDGAGNSSQSIFNPTVSGTPAKAPEAVLPVGGNFSGGSIQDRQRTASRSESPPLTTSPFEKRETRKEEANRLLFEGREDKDKLQRLQVELARTTRHFQGAMGRRHDPDGRMEKVDKKYGRNGK
jgi:hypothetical protein